jgi:hypothetical protein
MNAVYRVQTAVVNLNTNPLNNDPLRKYRSDLKAFWAAKTCSIVSILRDTEQWASDFAFFNEKLRTNPEFARIALGSLLSRTGKLKEDSQVALEEAKTISDEWDGVIQTGALVSFGNSTADHNPVEANDSVLPVGVCI